ncbi:MAG: phosphoribosyl-AMP cyclohydrolase [Hyphomicrobiales bacterium]|nr:phosphoribosyl-AMP cyclohydrolase [Hyphomicrobiales bacterium]
MSRSFAPRRSVAAVEEGLALAPKFDSQGLLPVITTDAASGEVLMHGYMNDAALLETLKTGRACYWSRSRQSLWRKGETSGLVQTVREMRIDDDQDALWLKVDVGGAGASCHVGYRSCFYRSVPSGQDMDKPLQLKQEETSKLFDPAAVYGEGDSPTKL